MDLGTSLGIGAATGVLSGVENMVAQQQTNAAQSQMADRQMQFQETMSNTAHQREVADLKAAGLNPILSATGGSGASTPTGAMAQLQAPQIHLPDFMSYGISLKQIEQAQQRLNIDQGTAAAKIAESLSGADLNKVKTQMETLGIPRQQIESDTLKSLQQMFRQLKDSVLKPRSPSQPQGIAPQGGQPLPPVL